jgi:hypothetical protein
MTKKNFILEYLEFRSCFFRLQRFNKLKYELQFALYLELAHISWVLECFIHTGLWFDYFLEL